MVSVARARRVCTGPSTLTSRSSDQTNRAPTNPSPWSTIRSEPRVCRVPSAVSSDGSRSAAVSKP